MVSKEMRRWGKAVVTLSQEEYRKLEGLLKECLPNHVPIDIERVGNNIRLWSRYPKVTIKAVEKAREMLKKYGFESMAVIAEERAGKSIDQFVATKKTVVKKVKTKKKIAKKRVMKKKAKVKKRK